MERLSFFDYTILPFRVVIGPATSFPKYMNLEPGPERMRVKFFLLSLEFQEIGADRLRAVARDWPYVGQAVGRDAPYPVLIEAIMDAIDRSILAAVLVLEDEKENANVQDVLSEAGVQRAMLSETPPEMVAGASFADKLQMALEKVPDHVGRELGGAAQKEIEEMLNPTNIAITVGILVVWGGSHAVGVGFVVDAVLLAVGLAFAGWAALDAFELIGQFFKKVSDASNENDIDEAGKLMAKAIAILSIAGFKALMRKAGKVRHKQGGGGVSSGGDSGGIKHTSYGGGSSSRKRKRSSSGSEGGPAKKKKTGAGDGGGKKKDAADSGGGKKKKKRRKKTKREKYLGRTPGKKSRTGREVRERMRKEGTVRKNRRTGKDEFKAEDGNWYPVDSPNTHMGHHPKDAVDYWNEEGIKHGAKSKEVRKWMLDSDNYRFEYGPLNSSRGGATKSRYKDPT